MQRRQFIGTSITAGIAALSSSIGMARGTRLPSVKTTDEVTVLTEISSNHGHELVLDIAKVVQLLQKTHKQGAETISIQGASGHDHQIRLAEEDFTKLLAEGKIEQESTSTGHTHQVTITVQVS